ncbi:ribonuclease J [Mesomycoplasma ovipneumoniae]|uniref:ribonuclease J n=1 Tax=Mesomycoplasma ovipneumoniae TaxID=29562 RepID=UPI002964C082|nr:ribonuclease J [Mesomycoplasma ovipneumoniae]MDW2834300.1 ribonuclease J [Mesomycoplasma ovipneumoniae]
MSLTTNPTRFFGLGGMQEIGKSTLIIEDNYDIVIIDAGIKFANLFSTGIKGMVPNYQYLLKNQTKIRGIFITHGHEDHIGGIVYLVQEVQIKKIFAPKIAIEYLKAKFVDHKIKREIEFVEIKKDDVYYFESFKVDFWTAQHSIPDAFGVRVTSRHGSIMCTGDFRFDYTPIGNYTDFDKLKQIGKNNLTVLFSDSTNAMRPNHSPSERDILADIEMHMRAATRKIIITAFASNLTRIKALIEIGIKLDKKILVFGRSMVNGINIGRRSGYINAPDEAFLGKNLSGVEENQMLILTTGSQGEQLAALDRMSNKKHPKISIEPRDMVIFSSSPIPGNKIKIEHLINRLYKLGAIIKENGPDGYLHTSGHAYKSEHEKIFQLTKPKYFFPYHGEYRMALAHSQTAIESGVNPKNVIIPDNGEVFEIVNQEVRKTKRKIPCEPIYIDGDTISRDNSRIINERQYMRENGVVFIFVPFDKKNNEIKGRISIITKGVFSIRTGSPIIADIRRISYSSIRFFVQKDPNWSMPQLKQLLKNRLGSYFHRSKRWNPVVLSKFIFVDEKFDFLANYEQKEAEKFVDYKSVQTKLANPVNKKVVKPNSNNKSSSTNQQKNGNSSENVAVKPNNLGKKNLNYYNKQESTNEKLAKSSKKNIPNKIAKKSLNSQNILKNEAQANSNHEKTFVNSDSSLNKKTRIQSKKPDYLTANPANSGDNLNSKNIHPKSRKNQNTANFKQLFPKNIKQNPVTFSKNADNDNFENLNYRNKKYNKNSKNLNPNFVKKQASHLKNTKICPVFYPKSPDSTHVTFHKKPITSKKNYKSQNLNDKIGKSENSKPKQTTESN